ncbi:hypothetical protein WUBG_01079 [Wuchereria bancrofti]|uniref:LITAF domain-containing protein n=1 Tax=Wuchereria bancrofti TaxID=6293 RepID=J9FKV4_WUCBA|nr:hypothetical protein WUBG_01079 [Wuchereria bancrofti]
MTGDISSAPPPYTPTSGNEAKLVMFPTSQPESVQLLHQPQHSLPPCLQKCTFPSSLTQPPAEPIIMPIVMTQPTVAPYPYQQQISDKPVNVVVNANNRTEENSLGRDYRICNFCKRGIMKKKKYVALPLLFNLMFYLGYTYWHLCMSGIFAPEEALRKLFCTFITYVDS